SEAARLASADESARSLKAAPQLHRLSGSAASLAQQGSHIVMLFLRGPGERRSPGLRFRLHWIGAPIQEQTDQLLAAPTASPPERRALQQVIPQVHSRAGVQ